jgi:hypothetical protein
VLVVFRPIARAASPGLGPLQGRHERVRCPAVKRHLRVFVRDPALVRSARATVDGTAILAIGGRPGVPYEISRWERAWFPLT